jgi:hypothetical protein
VAITGAGIRVALDGRSNRTAWVSDAKDTRSACRIVLVGDTKIVYTDSV